MSETRGKKPSPLRRTARAIAARSADLEARIAELEDLRLRALADLDNVRKRCAAQIRRAEAETRAAVTREWLPVIDNLDRALEHSAADPAAVVEGVRATRDQALAVLSRLGFPRRDDHGAMFDPARHEAIAVRSGRRRRGRHGRGGDPAGLRRGRPPAAARAGGGGQAGLMARPRLLRDPGRAEERQPGRDPAGLPQAGPHVSPGRQLRPRPPRTASRTSPRPTTSCPIRRPDAATTRSEPTSARCPRTWIRRPGGAAGPAPERRLAPAPATSATARRPRHRGPARRLLRRPGRAACWGPIAGADQEAELELTVEEAYHGMRRTITVRPATARAGPSTSPCPPA